MKIKITDAMCAITKKVVNDFNSMSNTEFFRKYYCTKDRYCMRVKLFKDPYMNAPLAKIGKLLIKKFK